MVQQNSMTCSTDGNAYYKALRQGYLLENYHLQEQYVKIIFNCIHNTEFIRTCSGLKLQCPIKDFSVAHKLLKICQSAKYFGQQEKEDQCVLASTRCTMQLIITGNGRRQSQLHILWGPTFQAPKHIKHIQLV